MNMACCKPAKVRPSSGRLLLLLEVVIAGGILPAFRVYKTGIKGHGKVSTIHNSGYFAHKNAYYPIYAHFLFTYPDIKVWRKIYPGVVKINTFLKIAAWLLFFLLMNPQTKLE